MVTLLWPGKEFRISGLEMIKGIRWGGVRSAMSYLDELVVPIIENTPDEEDLRDTMAEVCRRSLLHFETEWLPCRQWKSIQMLVRSSFEDMAYMCGVC